MASANEASAGTEGLIGKQGAQQNLERRHPGADDDGRLHHNASDDVERLVK
jgi:hypothetical protein